MHTTHASTGIEAIGDVPWGAHFCQFYRTRDDLVDTLVPFFREGLKSDEQCIWVTSEPFCADDAKEMLARAEPDLARYLDEGRIEVLDHDEWYVRSGAVTAAEILTDWVAREKSAIRNGRRGLRVTGNVYWLEPENWSDFAEYEALVGNTFNKHRIIACCSYSLDRVTPEGILDVVKNHDFALVRRNGEWEFVENASVKMAKAEVVRLNEQLEDRVRQRTAQLERALAARDEFLSIASHELKTPITSLVLYVGALQRAQEHGRLDAAEVTRRLGKATEQCDRLDQLVNRLLDVSRARSGRLDLTYERCDLSAVVRATIERHAEAARAASCVVEMDSAAPLVGRFDRLRVEQVLGNLIGNAFRHAPGATVRVSVALEKDDEAAIEVRDNGPGLPPGSQDRIFERFVQIGGGAPAGGGFGLGLFIAREIARAHGGDLEVKSPADEVSQIGASFLVRLPLRSSARG